MKTEKVATTVNIYSERARKEITTNFRFNKAFTYHNIKKIQKNEIVISCLALFYKTFFFYIFWLHALWLLFHMATKMLSYLFLWNT